MRFLLMSLALVALYFGRVQAQSSTVNINFADLFQGLDLSADEIPPAVDDADCALFEELHFLPYKGRNASDGADTHLYAADGMTLLPADQVAWEDVVGVYTMPNGAWAGTIYRPSSFPDESRIDISPGNGDFSTIWPVYYWSYLYYDMVDWQLLSRAGEVDDVTGLTKLITVARAKFQKKSNQVVYDAYEIYASFYTEDQEGNVKQSRFVYIQDGYDFGASWDA